MTSTTSRVSDHEVGRRLRVARRTAKVTQADAAKAIQVSRAMLAAIEQGRRRTGIRELQELAFLYGTSANAILRRDAVHVDLVPRFRELPGGSDEAVDEAARLLARLAVAEVELENALGAGLRPVYPPERPILPGDHKVQAEQDAQFLRAWIGRAAGPVKDIFWLVAFDLGIRVYQAALDPRISGLFAYDDQVGACILLNGACASGSRKHSVAVALGRFNAMRSEPGILWAAQGSHSRKEAYAAHFARAFLAPARAVRQCFERYAAGHSHFTRQHVILLAHEFHISRKDMVRRLEELKLVRVGTWERFEEMGGITDKEARLALAPLSIPGDSSTVDRPISPRLALLVREAWKRDLYSEGQLSGMLGIHLIDFRKILDGAETERYDAEECFQLPSPLVEAATLRLER